MARTYKPRPQKGFVALNWRGHPILGTTRFLAKDARVAAGEYWKGGWDEARKKHGWRIWPCIIMPKLPGRDA